MHKGKSLERLLNHQSLPPEAPKTTDSAKLRAEFNREIKPYRAQRENYRRLEAAVADPSGANDVALIFNYMKMLDPASVVREGEYATARDRGEEYPDIHFAGVQQSG